MTDTPEMVERVARAIQQQWDSEPDEAFRFGIFNRMAEKAIEAMREPSDAMEDAGYNTTLSAPNIWAAMIDAALETANEN